MAKKRQKNKAKEHQNDDTTTDDDVSRLELVTLLRFVRLTQLVECESTRLTVLFWERCRKRERERTKARNKIQQQQPITRHLSD
jgi:hypothetical protein